MSIQVKAPEGGGAAAKAGRIVNRLAGWLALHWLATFNAIVAVFVGLPFLAPVLLQAGAPGPARVIYTLYAPTCHQLPERSFFLYGPQAAYSVHELEERGALPGGLNILDREGLRWNGEEATGFKVAICQRDIAIYGSILLSGLLFGALRGRLPRRGRVLAKMPLWLYGLLLLPVVVDGATQLFGLRESAWPLRLLTGGLMGAATVWLAYPYIQDAMEEARSTIESAGPETGQKGGLEI